MRNVIFDLGGVLFHWNSTQIIERYVAGLGIQQAERPQMAARLRQHIFDHVDWLETDRGRLSAADAVVRFAQRMECSVDEMQQLWDLCSEHMQPRSDTVALMHELAELGAPLYCLSNMPVERYAWLRQQNDLWHLFQGIVISGEIALIKPDAAIYHHLLNRFGLRANDCIFLDDSPPNVAAANAVGIHAILFKDAASCRDELFALLDNRDG